LLTVSLVTLGSPDQLTGGYLYHRRMAEAASRHRARLTFTSFPDRPFPLPALAARSVLERALAAHPDILVVDSIAAAFLAPRLRSHGLTVPLAAVLHQPPGGIDHRAARARLQAGLDRVVYRRAARLVAASQALADELVAGGFPPARIRVVPPGRDPVPPPGPPRDLRGGRRAAVLSVGNWVARKDLLALLDAFSGLPRDLATLHLVGRQDVEPRYATRVRARLASPDLAGRVVVHGPLPAEEVADLYRSADLFALPSLREPYGTVYGEALAAGLPVLGWRAGNLPHLAAHGREGLLVPPGDVAGLATALERLATDEELRHRLARAARERGRRLPTWDETAAAFFSVLREPATEKGGGAR
jgi:glycosyltransferase involved in cell wall biosynthesis